jgi:hypothetical protein
MIGVFPHIPIISYPYKMLFNRNGINLLLLVPIGIIIGLALRLSGWQPNYKPFQELLAPENSTPMVCLMTTLTLIVFGLYINCTVLYYRLEQYLFPIP